jgi:membrane carboxypeptidase/penicillin-binding protein PbpC
MGCSQIWLQNRSSSYSKVTDNHNRTLEEYTPPDSPIFGKRAISGVAYIISDILADNKARTQAFGPNSQLFMGKDVKVSVKTGTTNDYRDNWTIGYTPSFVVATWVGNNDNTPMSNIVSGVTGAAPIWHKTSAYMLENYPVEEMALPDDIIGKNICSGSGQLATTGGCSTRFEYFLKTRYQRKMICRFKRCLSIRRLATLQNLDKQTMSKSARKLSSLIRWAIGTAHLALAPLPILDSDPTLPYHKEDGSSCKSPTNRHTDKHTYSACKCESK